MDSKLKFVFVKTVARRQLFLCDFLDEEFKTLWFRNVVELEHSDDDHDDPDSEEEILGDLPGHVNLVVRVIDVQLENS